jgi:hypothetical protein
VTLLEVVVCSGVQRFVVEQFEVVTQAGPRRQRFNGLAG